MQRPDEHKRGEILRVAAELFHARPFHEVRLDDIAAAARIGKGTIYTYFRSKEEIYVSLIMEGLNKLFEELRPRLGREDCSAVAALREFTHSIVSFALAHPHVLQLMRSETLPLPESHECQRAEILNFVADIIRRGVARGELVDPHPEWTTQMIPGAMLEIMTYADDPIDGPALADHLIDTILRGIVPRSG